MGDAGQGRLAGLAQSIETLLEKLLVAQAGDEAGLPFLFGWRNEPKDTAAEFVDSLAGERGNRDRARRSGALWAGGGPAANSATMGVGWLATGIPTPIRAR